MNSVSIYDLNTNENDDLTFKIRKPDNKFAFNEKIENITKVIKDKGLVLQKQKMIFANNPLLK